MKSKDSEKKIVRQLFGTDGVRGVANIHPMTSEIAMQIGRAIAFLVKDRVKGHHIVIGKDTRLSGYMIENALASGICSMGVNVQLVGPMPTPGIAFITTSMRADAGVVISASHNPFQDNGIKIFSRDGFKLPDNMEAKIEELIFSQKMEALRPVADEIGKASRIDDSKGRYIVFLKNTFPKKYTLDDFHIVLDCAHGATYKVAPHVFSELGARVTKIGVDPDGKNINQNCGALHPDAGDFGSQFLKNRRCNAIGCTMGTVKHYMDAIQGEAFRKGVFQKYYIAALGIINTGRLADLICHGPQRVHFF